MKTSRACGGRTAGTGFGQLQVASTGTLTGSLRVELTGGFLPAVNDPFTVRTAGTRSDTFVNFLRAANPVTRWLSNCPTSVILHVDRTSVSNITYRLEFRPDLATFSNWNPIPGDVTALSNTASKLDPLPSGKRLNRVRILLRPATK